jgi:SNF2 family DNA or RNA helicase
MEQKFVQTPFPSGQIVEEAPAAWIGYSENSSIPFSWLPGLKERILKERQRWLTAAPGLDDGEGFVKRTLPDEKVWRFLTEDSVRLAEAGAAVLLPAWWEQVKKQKVRLRAKVRSSVGAANSMFGMDAIIDFDWRVALGEAQLSEAEFLRLAEEKQRLFRVNGEWVLLDPVMLEAIRKIMNRTRKKKGLTFREAMELHLLGGTDILSGGESEEADSGSVGTEEGLLRLEVELNEHLGKMLGQLQQTSKIPLLPDPAGFQGELRRYQREGVSWMAFLSRFGLGGCLADDMGLGKTIQWIVYLLYLKENGQLETPALLICPTSVIGNWQKELERFAPELRVQLHYGAQRAKGEAFPSSVEGMDVVITSYTLTQLDEESLAQVEWSALCLDEAQNIKNAYTKQASAVRRLNARHRIALTGTPIENRLTELWSIFDVVNPGYLGSLGEFRRNFVNEVEKGNSERIGQVQQLIKPFLLRRVKKDPAIQLDLPDKNEMKTFVPLTAEQGVLYESIVQDMLSKVETLSPMERRGLILATLTRLKQVCDHPLLLVKKGNNAEENSRNEEVAPSASARQSAKLTRLLEMVEELRVEGDKCLIFTQFAQMGRLLQDTLAAERGEAVLFLHGGVPKAKRDEMVARFQEDADTGIFVLSLKAGGTGLNLTAANHVFHFDRWWNPAVENQATDRAFRIGQSRDVQVHKFISLGTLEERIDQMIDKKQGLSQQIIGSGENWITELSTDELRDLFVLRRQWMEE